jgi:hypothetical protein
MPTLYVVKGAYGDGDRWLGMLMGLRLWYGFYGSVLESEVAFEAKVSELCRELGDRGRSTSA